jgi:hypothetical protein
MRSPEPALSWPRISSGLAMVKPGGDAAAVLDLLAGQFVIEQPIVRILSTHDVDEFYQPRVQPSLAMWVAAGAKG